VSDRAARSPAPRPARAALGLTGALTMPLVEAGADLVGHGGLVRAIVVSADGQRVLTGGFDSTARLWDLALQRPLATLTGNAGPVHAVAFLPDGQRVVVAGDDGSLALWAPATSDPPRRWRAHAVRATAVGVGGADPLIASAGWDGTVAVWHAIDGSESIRVDHGAAVTAVAVAADGRRLASGDREGRIRVWALAGGDAPAAWHGHALGVTALAWTPDGDLLSAGIDGAVRIWDVDGRRERRTLEGHDGPILALAAAADGRHAVTGGRDGQIILWSVPGTEPHRWLARHPSPVWAVAVSPDGRFLLSAGADAVVRVRWLATGEPVGETSPETAEPKPWLTSPHPGARLFRACAGCHTLTPDALRRAGPHFAGLFGRRAGAVDGYDYSPALMGAAVVWDRHTLGELMRKGPEEFVPGSRMPLQRLDNPEDIEALVDYLQILTTATAAGPRPEWRPESR
jgi:cytochrome c